MKITKFTRNQLKLLLEIYDKGEVTSATQKTYWRYAFYLNISSLNDAGLVVEKGVNKNNQKVWTLTPVGREVVRHLKAIEEVLGG